MWTATCTMTDVSDTPLPLTDDEIAALASTAVRLSRFAQDVGDVEALAVLIDVVGQSARANESISQLKARLMRLDARIVAVAHHVANLL